MRKSVYVAGTLGDSYIFLLKMLADGSFFNVFHYTKHKYFEPAISEIYGLSCKVGVEFIDKPRLILPEITSDSHDQPMIFFPLFDLRMDISHLTRHEYQFK